MQTIEQTDPQAPPGPAPRRFALPARMDVSAAEELAEALEHLRGTPVRIDGAAVEQVSTLCLQLIAAARLQWRDDDVPFALTAPSPALREGLALLDLARVFDAMEAPQCP